MDYEINRGECFLVDLPGYGYARVPPGQREKIKNLIVWYIARSGAPLKVVALIIDAVAGLTDFDSEMLSILREENIPYVMVMNKVDKLNQQEFHKNLAKLTQDSGEHTIIVCGKDDPRGVNKLRERLFA
jgi:GTP-binding protein